MIVLNNQQLEAIVREVMASMMKEQGTGTVEGPAKKSQGLSSEKDYPLATKRPELVKTPTGKSLSEITLEKVLQGQITSEEVRITPETLRMQAEIADDVGRVQFGDNLRRAAEMTAIPDDRVLEMYNALRPYRSSKAELIGIAGELEKKYGATICASLVREAAEVYERRNRLRAD